MAKKPKLIRITTIPDSLKILLKHQIRFMQQKGFEVTMVSAAGDSIKFIEEQEQAPHVVVPLTRKITPLKDLYCLLLLVRFFLKTKPQIVHSHTPKAGTLGMMAAKLTGVPFRLHTIAGLPLLEAKGKKRTLLNFVEKITYACATHVYPNSKNLEQIIIEEKFCKPDKLKVLGNGSSNGIDTTLFNVDRISSADQLALKKELGINEDDFVFIFVGRLVGDKGVNELIAAFEKLSKENSHVKLLLVGGFETELDPLDDETLASITANPQILSVGFQKDVRPYFAIAKALVFPSYREGFPNSVMQAGAMGLPSIVTNINGCNEIIIPNENGLIIPVKDTLAIYDAMKKYFDDPLLWSKLKENSRTLIVSRYEQNLVWDAILEEYQKLIN